MMNDGPIQKVIRPVASFFDAATRPSADITRRDHGRTARTLAWVTLSFFLLIAVTTFITLPEAISDLPNHNVTTQPMYYIGLAMLVVCIGAFILSRTRLYQLGGLIFVMSLELSIYLSAVLGDIDVAGRIELLSWLSIPILVGSFMLSTRDTALLCSLSFAGIAIFPVVQPSNEIGTLVGVLSLMAVFSMSIVLIKRQRDYLEEERHRLLLDRQAELETHVAERTRELETANEQLETLTKIRNEVVSNISHDLRTPITSIKMNHELIRRDPAHRIEYLDRLERETTRLQQSVEQLLQVSRIDRQQLPIYLAPIDLNEMVLHLAEDREAVASSKQLTLLAEVTPDLPQVSADYEMIGQVLGILLNNAFNYTPAGGKVLIQTAAHHIDGTLFAGFRVSDTGPGIPADEQGMIFERFYRGKLATEGEIPGTGIGLFTARAIVERHRGRVEVASDGVRGHGAVFKVWLPVDMVRTS